MKTLDPYLPIGVFCSSLFTLVQESVGASDTAPDSQSHYLLAVAREFFEGHPMPAAIVATIETRSVARELRDHPNRWLLLPRLGPPAPIDGAGRRMALSGAGV